MTHLNQRLDNLSQFGHSIKPLIGMRLRIHAIHHIDLGQIGVMHDLPLPPEIAQGLLLAQNGYNLSQELGYRNRPDLLVLNHKENTSMVCWMELVMINSFIGSSFISFYSCSFVQRPWKPKQQMFLAPLFLRSMDCYRMVLPVLIIFVKRITSLPFTSSPRQFVWLQKPMPQRQLNSPKVFHSWVTDFMCNLLDLAPTITGSLMPEWMRQGQTNSVAQMLRKVEVLANPLGELMKVLSVMTSLHPRASSILTRSDPKQVQKSMPSVTSLSLEGEEGSEQGKKGMMAVTDSAPSFFIVAMARNSSMSPSLIFLGQNDLMMNTLCPLTESSIWICTYPSLNFPQMCLPSPISR